MPQSNILPRSLPELARRTALVVIICSAFAVTIVGLWKAADATFALAFGILIAVVFDAGARGLGYLVPWDRRVRLLIVIVLTFTAALAGIWWGGTRMVTELNSFAGQMQNLAKHAQVLLHAHLRDWLAPGQAPPKVMPDIGVVLGDATAIIHRLFEFIIFFLVAIFVGAFGAWEPQAYKAAFLSLLPAARRPRVSEVMDRAGHAMRSWLIGRLITMILIFLFTLCALTLVGMPNSVLLAMQAGLFTFVPTLGPLLAGIVIVLAGLAESESMALYGVGTYILVQFLESHIITPLVQRRTIRIPPAITLGLQLLAASLFGLFAVIAIIPLAAAGKVFLEELYIKDRLGGGWHPEQD
jgi:predicted PurR-regulated permease PerM